MSCSTHHNACTCREAYFELVTQERNDNVKWSAELRAQVQTLKQESSFWMGQTAIYKNALAQRTPDTPELPDDLIAAGTRAQWDWDGEAVDDRGAYYLGFVAGAKWQSEKDDKP